MSYGNTNEVVNKLFKPLFSIYKTGLETSMKETDFVFDSVQLLY